MWVQGVQGTFSQRNVGIGEGKWTLSQLLKTRTLHKLMSVHSKLQEVSEATSLMASYTSAKQMQGACDNSNRKGIYPCFPTKELPKSVINDLSGFSSSS